MATVIPVDEFVTDEWYPGFKPAYDHAPWIVDPVDTFKKKDEETFWFLDFHWPRGMTPMGWIWNEDGYNWGTQLAAETLPLPPGRGITSRFAGTHIYGSSIPVTDPREIGARAKRIEKSLPPFLQNFDSIWAARREEVEDAWNYFRSIDLESLSLSELGENLVQARAYHKRSFEIHFEVMYPLLANFVGFYGQCVEFGLDPGEIGKFLQGYDTKIMETDRELWRLTSQAKAAGLGDVFASAEPEQVRAALSQHGGAAGTWLTQFDDFLQVYGWRTEGSCDIALASWIEDPTPALGMIKTFLQKPAAHDFEKARAAAIAEREEAIDAARSRLTREEQAVFDGGLASCQAANFPWWQDDHNYYMDLKVSLPMRWACQAIAERVGADADDDMFFLFWPENMKLVRGEKKYSDYRSIIEARKQYFDYWGERRATMPKMLGTIPSTVDDPILIEIFGLNPGFLQTIRAASSGEDVRELKGIGASKGVARGIARVLSNADELHRIQPGEVLVCESTSPNWTPAFAKIAACVCDGGGTLSHAAIVGREYGVPTVTAVGLATLAIKDGDEVEVDGTTGTVTVFRSADAMSDPEAVEV
jgi:phosphohistidine swiveling domain-containing protein